MRNAPGNAKYTSPTIQKEVASIIARKVQISIKQEIGNGKFTIMVDESRDESKKEQMAVVIRFVNIDGEIRERFLDLIHVSDTCALTLKNAIIAVLVDNGLSVQDIRGQGYDGASNMRGEWNGLKALIIKECPSAYYDHCLAHQWLLSPLQRRFIRSTTSSSMQILLSILLVHLPNVMMSCCKIRPLKLLERLNSESLTREEG